MSFAWIELGLYLVLLLLAARPLGAFMAPVLEGGRSWLTPVLGRVERWCYRFARVNSAAEMEWKRYTLAMMAFNLVSLLAVYALQRIQHLLPLNPAKLGAVTPDSSFNTAV